MIVLINGVVKRVMAPLFRILNPRKHICSMNSKMDLWNKHEVLIVLLTFQLHLKPFLNIACIFCIVQEPPHSNVAAAVILTTLATSDPAKQKLHSGNRWLRRQKSFLPYTMIYLVASYDFSNTFIFFHRNYSYCHYHVTEYYTTDGAWPVNSFLARLSIYEGMFIIPWSVVMHSSRMLIYVFSRIYFTCALN